MDDNLLQRLRISPDRVEALNDILLNPDMRVMDDFLTVDYGRLFTTGIGAIQDLDETRFVLESERLVDGIATGVEGR